MIIAGFPSCCGARVITGFGGGSQSSAIEQSTKQQIIGWIADKLNTLKFCSVVYAMPTTTQPNTIAALEELGFYTHPNPEICYNSNQSKEHLLLPYFIAPKEFDLKEFNSRYNPEEDTYENKRNTNYDQLAEERAASGRHRVF